MMHFVQVKLLLRSTDLLFLLPYLNKGWGSPPSWSRNISFVGTVQFQPVPCMYFLPLVPKNCTPQMARPAIMYDSCTFLVGFSYYGYIALHLDTILQYIQQGQWSFNKTKVLYLENQKSKAICTFTSIFLMHRILNNKNITS